MSDPAPLVPAYVGADNEELAGNCSAVIEAGLDALASPLWARSLNTSDTTGTTQVSDETVTVHHWQPPVGPCEMPFMLLTLRWRVWSAHCCISCPLRCAYHRFQPRKGKIVAEVRRPVSLRTSPTRLNFEKRRCMGCM